MWSVLSRSSRLALASSCATLTLIRKQLFASVQAKTSKPRPKGMNHRGVNLSVIGDVYQVGGGGFTSKEDAGIYLVDCGSKAVLIDSGCGSQITTLFDNIHACGFAPKDVEVLLLTHCHFDHTGGAEEVRNRTGCKIVMHEIDAEFVEKGDTQATAANWYGRQMKPFKIDQKLKTAVTPTPQDTLTVGNKQFTAVFIPGHTPGSLAFTTKLSDGKTVVFAQDVHGPLHPAFHSNKTDYKSSLQRLIDLKADVLCEGHYGVYHGQDAVREFIWEFL